MSSLRRILYRKSFWFLFLLGLNLATGQMPFDQPFSAFLSLVLLGFVWIWYDPFPSDAFIWGLGFSLGYFGVTFIWIMDPFLVEPRKTGWLAPGALLCMVGLLSLILSMCFFLAAKLGNGKSQNQRIIILFLFFSLSELIRSDLLLGFPWGLISSMWINTPISQMLALFGPFCLSCCTILSAFLITRFWFGSVLGVGILLVMLGYGYNRLGSPIFERPNPIKVRIVQPNIKQAEKWEPALAPVHLKKHIGLSKSAKENGIDLIIWPETATSYGIDQENKLRDLIADSLGVALILGSRRFDDKNKNLYNSAFMLAENGDILDVYDKIKLVPFGEYIPFGKLLNRINIFGFATDGLTGFSSGESIGLFKTNNAEIFKIIICYESIFSNGLVKPFARPSWIVHITNDAWFGDFNGPQQHLTLARMRAIEQGLPIIRSANTGISAIIGPYGRIHSKIDIDKANYLDHFLPASLKPTFYASIGARLCNLLLILVVMLTIVTLIFINLIHERRQIN